jgi:methionine-rich copper-binding protein CopC
VIDRLEQEHLVIDHVLARVDRALVQLVEPLSRLDLPVRSPTDRAGRLAAAGASIRAPELTDVTVRSLAVPHRGSLWARLVTIPVLAVALLFLVGTGSAAAHDVLIGTDPADGAVLSAPPAQVKLTFAQQALSIGTRMRVTGPSGAVVSSRPVQVIGSYVTQPLDPGLDPGAYTVVWRVTSADGHPVSGTFAFSLAGSAGVVSASSPAKPTTAGSWSTARVTVVVVAGLAAVLVCAIAMIVLVRRSGRSARPPA